ncbi:MAG: hypothetical protein ABSA46_13690, partial [Thermodesulfovibrionales bacterium]
RTPLEEDDWRAVFAKSDCPVRRGGAGDRTISATTPALYSTVLDKIPFLLSGETFDRRLEGVYLRKKEIV